MSELEPSEVFHHGLVDEQVCQLARRHQLTILTSDGDEIVERARRLDVSVRSPARLLI